MLTKLGIPRLTGNPKFILLSGRYNAPVCRMRTMTYAM